MKKIIKFLIALTLIFSQFGFITDVFADDDPTILYSGTDGDLDWSINSDGLLLIEGEGDYDSDPDWMWYSGIKTAKINVKNITTCNQMFLGISTLTSVDVSNFDTSKVTNMASMFFNCSSLSSLDLNSLDTSKVTDMSNMFYNCSSLSSLKMNKCDTSNVTNMGAMFSKCSSLTSLDLSKFDTSKVTNMASMFYNCKALRSVNLNNFNTSNVTSMEFMFCYCRSLESLNLSSFNTSKVTTMKQMFYECNDLTSINQSFDTSNVTDMNCMFYYCESLTSLDLSSFDTSKVTIMCAMFFNCNKLTDLDLSSFNTKNVTDMYEMFLGCYRITDLDLSGFDTSNVTDISIMFRYCYRLNTKLKISGNITTYTNCFENAASYDGGRILVYYDENECSKELAENIAATKSSTSNVILLTEQEVSADEANGHTWDEGTITQSPTCAEKGSKKYTCTVCGDTKTESIAKTTTHSYIITDIKKASTSGKSTGYYYQKCQICDTYKLDSKKKKVKTTTYYAKTLTLSPTSYTYSGDINEPTVTVKDSKEKAISSDYYTVTYSSNTNVGTAKVTVKMNTLYTGTLTKTFKINPAGTSLVSLTPASKAFTATWNAQKTQTTGYQICYSTSSKFKSPKYITVSGSSKTSYTKKSLSKKKKYYVRIRTYKTVGKTKYYSSWSKAMTVTTK